MIVSQDNHESIELWLNRRNIIMYASRKEIVILAVTEVCIINWLAIIGNGWKRSLRRCDVHIKSAEHDNWQLIYDIFDRFNFNILLSFVTASFFDHFSKSIMGIALCSEVHMLII
jgi:hypothetical protein